MSRTGKVYLVGAGPGDPGLITLKGLECLRQADLILYDGLVNPLLLRHSAAQAERTCRSASPDGRMLDQPEINERLIAAARAGKTVVRLKGGDPYIFGRGSEEAAALAAAGVEFEVVPGITAATAAAVYAGFSLTHRRFASAVAYVTGHEDPHKPDATLDYRLLAEFPGTLVFYMALHRLEAIAGALIEHGRAADTPASVISRATTPQQKTVTARLDELPAMVRSAELQAPSLLIVGECVRVREQATWFERKPLFGRRIGITRPDTPETTATINRALELGAQPVLLPTIRILPPADWDPVDACLARLDEFDWLVFTSVNGVQSLLERLWELGSDARRLGKTKVAAIGSGTAAALGRYRLRADVVPETFRAEGLVEALAPRVSGRRVLWARASRGRDVLPVGLEEAGAAVEQLVVYQNVDVERLPDEATHEIEQGRLDWIGLSSPSIARSLAGLLTPAARAQLDRGTRIAAISPVTSAAAREAGLPVHAEATLHTWDGLFAAIVDADNRSSQGSNAP